MKQLHILFLTLFSLIIFMGSCKDDEEIIDDPNVLGTVTVALDANKDVLRKGEAIMGNMFGEAWYAYVTEKLGKQADFAVPNGGIMRFDEATRSTGIFPAGDFTNDMNNEICFYDNNLVIVEVTGEQLKEILERSVASLPTEAKGWFLQCSKQIAYTADLSKQAQILDETGETSVIQTAGERITSIKINGTEYTPTSIYKMITTDYAAAGNDGFVTMLSIDASKKVDLGDYRQATIYYLGEYSPVTPTLGNRITLLNAK